MSNKIYDLIVIGAGPVGLHACFLANYLKLDFLCLEKDKVAGGQLTKLYPSKYIYDFPGQSAIKAQELIDILFSQSIYNQNVNDRFIFGCDIIEFDKLDDGSIKLVDKNGLCYYTHYVLFTVGPGAFEHIKIDQQILDNIDANNINYVFNKKEFRGDEKILILGGGDSALDYAYEFKKHFQTKNVYLAHRSDKFKGLSHSYDELKQLGVNIVLNANLQKISQDSAIFLVCENEFKIQFDYLLVQFGVNSLGSRIHQWLEFEKIKNRFLTNEYYETNVKGFYAAGNCSYKEWKIDMIITGVAEATIALNHIHYCLRHSNKHYY